MEIMASFTVRVVREGDETQTQLVFNGTQVVGEFPVWRTGLGGNEDYEKIFTSVLYSFPKVRKGI